MRESRGPASRIRCCVPVPELEEPDAVFEEVPAVWPLLPSAGVCDVPVGGNAATSDAGFAAALYDKVMLDGVGMNEDDQDEVAVSNLQNLESERWR